MIKLELDDDKAQILAQVLKHYLGDLSAEIADTDNMDFRESLKHRREVINTVLQTLQQEQ